MIDADGALVGGASLGAIFKLTPNADRTAWSYSVYARGADSPITITPDGVLFGAATFGGSGGNGWVVKVSP